MNGKRLDRWLLWIVAAFLVGGLALGSLVSGWFAHRLLNDFWPLDHSFVGPNILASVVQWTTIAIVVSVLYPPVRHAIERFVEHHVNDLRAHVSAENRALHAKMDHIIKHHPDIPPFGATVVKKRVPQKKVEASD